MSEPRHHIDLQQWVESEFINTTLLQRQCVHVFLHALSLSENLKSKMVLKGGMLLALRYSSPRHTQDMDFSTAMLRSEFALDRFVDELNENLLLAMDQLEYAILCKVQSPKYNPQGEDKTYPTIKMNIGYAEPGSKDVKHYHSGRASKVVPVELSLNEPVWNCESVSIDDNYVLMIYGLSEVIAEKFRALLQQRKRGRVRRQDIYDLHYILSSPTICDPIDKSLVLETLVKKAASRSLSVHKISMDDPEIRQRSQQNYGTLKDEIDGPLPDFDEAYDCVNNFYKSLPWS